MKKAHTNVEEMRLKITFIVNGKKISKLICVTGTAGSIVIRKDNYAAMKGELMRRIAISKREAQRDAQLQ